ncbi:MAG: helix-turn-helix transcriptional regulator [Clostridia bacterium]|nr:helix-turn-helix transcriptional regulator [Clostridia bacterium]
MIKYTVVRTKHNWKEPKDFKIMRAKGTGDWLLLHFKCPVVFNIYNETHHLESGTCILIEPRTSYSFYPDGCELIHDWIHFLVSDEDQFRSLKIDINNFFKPVDPGFITSSVKKCELELIEKNIFYEELISAELSNMFIKLKRQLQRKSSGYHDNILRNIRIEIFNNPEKFDDIDDLAKKANLSTSRFSVVYKNLFGISPKKDIINARISKAKYLLSLGSQSLLEISELCGYQNIYHFIRQFRTVTGITPGAYAKDYFS